jgi:hypothetical protein
LAGVADGVMKLPVDGAGFVTRKKVPNLELISLCKVDAVINGYKGGSP